MSILIGVATRGRDEKKNYSVNVEYLAAVRRAGGEPVLLPHGAADPAAIVRNFSGLLLIGGGDVEIARYGGRAHPEIKGLDPERDESEIAMIKCAASENIPLFSICRGIQVVNVALGGTLYEHIPDDFGTKLAHQGEPSKPVTHEVEVEPGSRLAGILEVTRCPVRSQHHQAIRTLAPKLVVCARSSDGVIEAVEMPGHKFFFGVQWHPELNAAEDPIQQRLFDSLISASTS